VEFELNGVPERVESVLSVQDLLARYGLAGRRVAVAINTQVVPRSRFAEVRIAQGDRVEVIHAVGGG
jgi:sulfur carrier protein